MNEPVENGVCECGLADDVVPGVDPDPVALAEHNEALGDCLGNALRLNISLDYIFGARGEPFMAKECA